jgi:hypothetical protein
MNRICFTIKFLIKLLFLKNDLPSLLLNFFLYKYRYLPVFGIGVLGIGVLGITVFEKVGIFGIPITIVYSETMMYINFYFDFLLKF